MIECVCVRGTERERAYERGTEQHLTFYPPYFPLSVISFIRSCATELFTQDEDSPVICALIATEWACVRVCTHTHTQCWGGRNLSLSVHCVWIICYMNQREMRELQRKVLSDINIAIHFSQTIRFFLISVDRHSCQKHILMLAQTEPGLLETSYCNECVQRHIQ